jgi:hypothetical protein
MTFAEIEAHAAARLEGLGSEIDTMFADLCVEQIKKWEKRFPRHSFQIAQSHGLLLFDVSPLVLGRCNPETFSKCRGAIGELAKEAQAFAEGHANLEWKIATGETDWIASTI